MEIRALRPEEVPALVESLWVPFAEGIAAMDERLAGDEANGEMLRREVSSTDG